MSMTAKRYLKQLEVLDTKINQRIKEKDYLKARAEGTNSKPLTPDKVQTSAPMDAMAESAVKYVDMEAEIDKMTDEFIDRKHKIIDEIQSLNCDAKYIDILFKRYVEFKSFEKISVEMSYEYKWTCKLHGTALKLFYDQVLKHDKTRTNTISNVLL